MDSTYTGLTKRADFTELEKVVEQNKAAYDKGFAGNVTDTDQNKYTVDSWQNFENAYNAGAALLEKYQEKDRNNVPGFTVGPDSAEKITTQTKIDETATQLKNSALWLPLMPAPMNRPAASAPPSTAPRSWTTVPPLPIR